MEKHSFKQRPKKSLGQNFLTDPNYQRKIIEALQRNYAGEPIIEIGPGRGALTQHLVKWAANLILIEKDFVLARDLQTQYAQHKNILVVCADFLKWDGLMQDKKVIVVGNLPYNVCSQIMIKLFQHAHQYCCLYLMMQKEMADRCVAKTHTKDYSMLTVWTNLFTKPRSLFQVPPTAFYPKPKVMSSFVQFEMKDSDYVQEAAFLQFVKMLFLHRRKKISTILKQNHLAFTPMKEETNIFLEQRVETLSLEELKRLFFDTQNRI